MEAIDFYNKPIQPNDDLKILTGLIQTVHKSSNLEEIYSVALDSVVKLENVDMAVIYLVDEEKQEAVIQAHRNFPEDYVKRASRVPYPKGITWKVINTGKILNIEDAQKDPNIGPAGRDLGHHSLLGIPIFLEEKVIGVIWFLSYKERKFNESEITLLSTLGNQIAIAIARAKQTEELKERNRNLSILSTISQAVNQTVDLNQIYNTVLDITKDLKFIDLLAVYLVEGEGDKREAVVHIHRGYNEGYLKSAGRIPYGRGITWKVIISGEPIFYEDASDPSTPMGPAGKALGARALLSIPVKSSNETINETIGVIHFSSFQKTSFTQQEMDFLLSLGSQIGTAIAKAKIFDEMKQRAQELKVLYENLKDTQEQLIQSEKLASLGELVSSIAHEINNPLTPIMAYSQLLLMRPDLNQATKKRLEVINTSADRVGKIIDKLLSFSRRYKLTREYSNINKILEKALDFRGYQLKLSNIDVAKDFDPELPKTMADQNQLQQVFLNIIVNAEQAMGDTHSKGQLTLRTRNKKEEGTIEICFNDDGPGIPKEILGKIFDPFFTTKPVGEGTGLGLSVSYGIIKEHGGKICALSEEGKGTNFIIEIPILEEEPILKKEKEVSEIPKIRGKRILVIEDEEIIINMIKSILEEEEHIVDLASNGEEALAKIDTNFYDLIVCDMKMPYMDGKRFYNEIKNKRKGLGGRIIFITGDPSDKTVSFINETGNKFLEKPFKIKEFKNAIYDSLIKL
jgi:signal transduction histidine kinase/putative methionine-R-sulfoxide reductase with GAF domain